MDYPGVNGTPQDYPGVNGTPQDWSNLVTCNSIAIASQANYYLVQYHSEPDATQQLRPGGNCNSHGVASIWDQEGAGIAATDIDGETETIHDIVDGQQRLITPNTHTSTLTHITSHTRPHGEVESCQLGDVGWWRWWRCCTTLQ